MLKKGYIMVLSVLASLTLFSQSSKIDSLLAIDITSQTNTAASDVDNHLSWEIHMSDSVKSYENTLFNLGVLHNNIEDQKTEEKYFQESIKKSKNSKDPAEQLHSLLNYGLDKLEQKKYNEAKKEFQKVEKIARGKNNLFFLSEALYFISYVNYNEGFEDQSQKLMMEAIQIQEKMGNHDRISDYYKFYSNLLLEKKDFRAAIDVIEKSMLSSKKANDGIISSKLYFMAAEALVGLSDYEQAILNYKLYYSAQDSIYNIEQARTIPQLDTQYRTEKEYENQTLKYERKETYSLLKQKTLNNVLLGTISILLLGFSFMLYRMYKSKSINNSDLEEEVKKRTQNLITANKKITKAYEQQERFTHMLSHDLKGPLRNISGFIQLINKNIDPSSKNKEYIGIAYTNLREMHELIDDVIEYTTIDNKTLKEKVSIDYLINRIESDLKLFLSEKKAKIIKKYNPDIKLPQQYYFVLKNLIENGIKYNVNPEPTIVIKSIIQRGDQRIRVSDNGIGIDKKFHKDIFIMFKRLNSKDKFPGSGIGLSLIKKIIEEYGGNIIVESEIDKGSSFSFSYLD